jgi:hypothetical protein
VAKPDRENNTGEPRLAQLKGGYNRVARDLDRAYSLARLTPAQSFLLAQIREASWKYSPANPDRKPRRIRLNLSALARISGFNRSGLSVQLAILIARRFVIGDPTEGVEPNKMYREWLDSTGLLLLSDQQIKWCLEIKRKVRTVERAQHAGAVNSTGGVERAQHPGAVNSTPPVERAQQSGADPSKNLSSSYKGPRGCAGGICSEENLEIATSSLKCVKEGHTHTSTTDRLPSQPQRDPSEIALINEACRVLDSHLSTTHLSIRLGREHGCADLLPLEGWRFVLAAHRQVSSRVPHAKKLGWEYFLTVVRNLDESERDAEPTPRRSAAEERSRLANEALDRLEARLAAGEEIDPS